MRDRGRSGRRESGWLGGCGLQASSSSRGSALARQCHERGDDGDQPDLAAAMRCGSAARGMADLMKIGTIYTT